MALVPGKLDTLRKVGECKILLAVWIRRHFALIAKWCADQLAMGTLLPYPWLRTFMRSLQKLDKTEDRLESVT